MSKKHEPMRTIVCKCGNNQLYVIPWHGNSISTQCPKCGEYVADLRTKCAGNGQPIHDFKVKVKPYEVPEMESKKRKKYRKVMQPPFKSSVTTEQVQVAMKAITEKNDNDEHPHYKIYGKQIRFSRDAAPVSWIELEKIIKKNFPRCSRKKIFFSISKGTLVVDIKGK